MSSIAVILYGSALFTFVVYLILKYRARKIIFSPFIISVYIYVFAFLITPYFYSSSIAWAAVGIYSASSMYQYLNESVCVNAGGLIILLFTMSIVELRHTSPKKVENSIVISASRRIDPGIMKIGFLLVIIAWYVIVLIYNHGLPLFNSGRTFYLHTGISPIYLALNELLLLMAIYYGLSVTYRHTEYLALLLTLATLLFTANRSSFLLEALAPIMIIYFLKRSQDKANGSVRSQNKAKRRSTRRIILLLVLVMLIGLALAVLRQDIRHLTINVIADELFNGNTFSDIRDGAYILRGYRNKYQHNLLLGKTYLAALISFIPSSLSAFRTEWSFGRFSSMGLFGMQNHFGLRGGWSMEAYLNFGVLGIIVASVMAGCIIGYSERMFYELLFHKETRHRGNEFFILYVIFKMNNFFVCSSGTYNIYVDLLFVIILLFLSRRVKIRMLR